MTAERSTTRRAPSTSTSSSRRVLAEGFGLTITEAMWKARPVVASGIGGIRSQIIDGESGILLDYLRVIRQIRARPGVRTTA